MINMDKIYLYFNICRKIVGNCIMFDIDLQYFYWDSIYFYVFVQCIFIIDSLNKLVLDIF